MSAPQELENLLDSVVSHPPDESMMDAIVDRSSSVVDIGPSAQPILAHEEFPRLLEPLISPSTQMGMFAHMKRRHNLSLGGAHSFGCSDCKGGASKSNCIVGGVEYAVGGWGKYEIDRRKARWEMTKESPAIKYGGRSHISSTDVAHSVLGQSSPLKQAAEHLARSLGKMQDAVCDPSDEGLWECLPPASLTEPRTHTTLIVPSLTSSDVREFIEDPDSWTDPDTLESLAEDATIVSASLGVYADELPPLKPKTEIPPLPARVIQTDDSAGVIRLEAATAPYIEGLERYQAAVAQRFDTVAGVIDKALAGRT